jgi:glucokinase
VRLGNDVNLGLLAERCFGAARGIDDALGVFVGTGVGGSVLAGGRLLLGQQGAAAELGHMVMDPDGPLCSCGNRGCLEAYAGRWAIERDIRLAVRRGEKTILKKLTDGRLKMIKSRLLRKALKRNDRLTERVMRSASLALGHACVSLRHIFDPKVIIFGGGVIGACGGFMLPLIARCLRQDPFFRRLKPCRLVISELGDDAVLLGAAALFLAEKK